MSILIAKEHGKEKIKLVDAYAKEIERLMKEDRDIVQVEADLGGCLLSGVGQWNLPKGQIFDVGIQEADMVGVSCGMSVAGKKPFCHSFSPFIARRANDVIAISGCYNRANVKMIGSDPGVFNANCGGTHTSYDDIGALRSIHNITILDIADSTMLIDIMRQLVNIYGMFYVRMARKTVAKIYEEGSHFEIGKGIVIRDGSDVTLFGSGGTLVDCLDAAELLKEDGISARVVDMFTIKPVDAELIVKCAQETGAAVTTDNHNVLGGLGSAVCEVLCEKAPIPVEMIGLRDHFAEVGTVESLKETFGMTAGDIAAAAKRAIARK